MQIKPIQTPYKGRRFRSRLEARWAVFFDRAGIKWEYEKEGFDLGSLGFYLPDFWLSNVGVRGGPNGMFVEIKGAEATDPEIKKLAIVSSRFGPAAMLQNGMQEDQEENEFLEVIWDSVNEDFCYDLPMGFMKCYKCGAVKYEFFESNYMRCDKCGSKSDNAHPTLLRAFEYALSARFEYGETP